MNIALIIRDGFSIQPTVDISSCQHIFHYKIGEPLARVWEELTETDAKFALFIDNVIPCNDRYLWLMYQIITTQPNASGITIHNNGLESVYQVKKNTFDNSKLPWISAQVKTLPSWLALIRISDWRLPEFETPEYHFLETSSGRDLLQIIGLQMDFDVTAWASDIISTSAVLLAADFRKLITKTPEISTPPQYRVTIPGQQQMRPLDEGIKTDPVFSIICPSIRPDFLKEAVDSIVAQIYKNWELWIGIDGPVESQRKKIEEILSAYQSDHRVNIRYFEHMGTGPLRKLLSEMTTGDYIMCFDDDDRLCINTLERFAKAIYDNPSAHILRGGIKLFGMVDAYLSPRTRYQINGISNDLFEANQPCVIKKDTLMSLGGFQWDPDLKQAGEDSDMLLKADMANIPVLLLDEPLYERRLSTLNQTLDCTAEECLNHINNLYRKHNPPNWKLDDIHLSGKGAMINMSSVHHNEVTSETVVCSTQFMDFQQVGSRENVIIDLEITSLCNAVCTFCPRSHLVRSARFISLDVVRHLAVSIKKQITSQTIVLCGIGESTLHPELTEIVSILANAGANVCMTTNGSNLSMDIVDDLVEVGLSEINISLNAASATTHADLMKLKNFTEIYAICKEIASARSYRWPQLKVHVSFVLNKKNEHEVTTFVNDWRETGVTQIWLHPLTNRAGQLSIECEPIEIEGIIQTYITDPQVKVDLFPNNGDFNNLCHIARGVDFISVDGEMLLCAQDYEAKHRFGNISQNGIDQLHHTKILQHLRGETSQTCSNCSFCPKSFNAIQRENYSIVQSGGY